MIKKLYAQQRGLKGKNKPLPFNIYFMGDCLFYQGEIYRVKKYKVGVREDGPDAYAGFVSVPENAWCRLLTHYGDKCSEWTFTESGQRVYLETTGSGVEYLKITEDNKVIWEVGIGYEI